ncbi:MAG TPA: VOC family protein [Candidatus Binataceae bacterium]|nr:VOC family protein [Candidatus Binataceae bacterium]
MVQVTELGYIGIEVKNVEEWKEFATQITGLELADDGERDRCYLRMDYWHHRIAMHAGPSDDLLYLGFRVAGGNEFREMQRQLADAGVEFRVGSDEEAAERNVLEVMKMTDPGGNPVEIFHGPEVQFNKPFHPGRPMHGRFKTGTGGLGHCIIRQEEINAAYRFYTVLGMRGGVEYKMRMGKNIVEPVFMHCNDRDHTVAFGIGAAGPRLNHIMIEVENFDDIGLTYEIVSERKIPIIIGPGKHSNDQMYSFYFRNPSGWAFEYGWGGRAATYQSEYYVKDMYRQKTPHDGPESKR